MDQKPTEKAHIEKRMLTVPEAAAYMGISKRTLYDRIAPKSKKPFPLPPKRIGGSVRFDKGDLDKWLDSL